MNRIVRQTLLLLGVGAVVTGCATQPVAPVVSGYHKAGKKVATAPKAAKPTPVKEIASPTPVDVVPAAVPPRAAVQPVTAGPQKATSAPPTPQIEYVSHTVKPTETPYKIASDYNTSVTDILAANNLQRASDIRPGQVLRIPSNSSPRLTAMDFVRQVLSGEGQRQVASASPIAAGVESIEPAAGPTTVSKLENRQLASFQTPVRTLSVPAVAPEEPAAPAFITHAVQPKETLFRISQTYKVSVFDIMAANAFETPQDLKAGTLVRVPVAGKTVAATAQPPAEMYSQPVQTAVTQQVVSVAPEAQTARVFEKPRPRTQKEATLAELKRGVVDPEAANAPGMVWPVKGRVLQQFGDAPNGVSHTGISIAVPPGTSVLASDAGTVLYADDGLKAYGKLVLIRHGNGMVSAYAHNSYLLVRKGERVKKGQVIATSGSTGNVADPQLHFELRQHASAVDPLRVLPKL